MLKQIRPAALGASIAVGLVACNEQTLDPLPATHDEVHFQGGQAPPVDVLWIVDNSGSMEQEQQKLANNFDSFITYFTDLGLDFHLAVTTTDTEDPTQSGRFVGGNPKVMDSTMSPAALRAAFIQAVSVGINGSGDEKGLEGARLALSEPLISTTNVGFLRENAILAIIIVSDEEDQSPLPVTEYVDFFKGLKGNDLSRINLSVIVGDVPNGCQSVDADADAGNRYYEAATPLSGVKASICATDFGPVLDQVGSVVAGLATAFATDYSPVIDTIRVTVDGVEIPRDTTHLTGWDWSTTIGGVVFAPSAIPNECSIVEIAYQVLDYGGPIQNNNNAPPPQCSELTFAGGDSLDGGAFDCSVGELAPGSLMSSLPGIGAILALGVLIFRRRAT